MTPVTELGVHRWSLTILSQAGGAGYDKKPHKSAGASRCDVLLAVARPVGWEPVTSPLTEVRTREHGTNPLPDPGWLPGAGTRADQVPAIRPGAACGSRSPGRPSGTEGEPARQRARENSAR